LRWKKKKMIICYPSWNIRDRSSAIWNLVRKRHYLIVCFFVINTGFPRKHSTLKWYLVSGRLYVRFCVRFGVRFSAKGVPQVFFPPKMWRQTIVLYVRWRIGFPSSLHANPAWNLMRNRTRIRTRVDHRSKRVRIKGGRATPLTPKKEGPSLKVLLGKKSSKMSEKGKNCEKSNKEEKSAKNGLKWVVWAILSVFLVQKGAKRHYFISL
jgi:hypothetical protein